MRVKPYSPVLYNSFGTELPRKNKALEAQAMHPGKPLTDQARAYQEALAAYKKAERAFSKALTQRTNDFETHLSSAEGALLKRLKIRLFEAEEKQRFYEPYVSLSYNAELRHAVSALECEQLPEIIEAYMSAERDIREAQARLMGMDSKQEQRVTAELAQFKSIQKERYKQGVDALREKRRDHLISDKALRNGIAELKRDMRSQIEIKSYDLPTKAEKALISSKRHFLKKGIRRSLKVLESNISDLRRRIPVEVPGRFPLASFLSIPIPGLGQLFNRQYLKALLFGIGALFIYFVAIPYALGYGNYQGWGIPGLVSLAEGGRKIDKSLIYMIEGIVAIFLLIFALGIYILAFKDAHHTEKNKLRGIRPKNWFETRAAIEQEGFPYMVSLPALVVTVFIVLVPIATAILLSFTNMDPQHQSKFSWVGLENYKIIATGSGLAGSVFWKILLWSVIWTLAATTLAIVVGFFLAILANNARIRGKLFFRIVFLLPWAVPAFITIMFFSIMLSPDGALTTLLGSWFGIHYSIKTDPTLSRVALILLQTWLGSSYVFLLSTGVLQAIPGDLYEAAEIDGASAWQKLRRITLPLVLFQTAPLLVGQYTFNFNNFSIIYLFNSGGPFNPVEYGNLAGSTDLLISYIFKLTMENQYQSIGAAITIVISLGLMFFAFIGFKNSKAFKEERL